MKINKFNTAIVPLLAYIFLSCDLIAQDSPKARFYTDNFQTEITKVDSFNCASTNDLSVKFPITADMFKYDKIMFIVFYKGDVTKSHQPIMVRSYMAKKFRISYENKSEEKLWVLNPNNESLKGDFGENCGQCGLFNSHPKQSLCNWLSSFYKWNDLKFSVMGFIKEGRKKYYDDYGNAYYTDVYDGGTALVSSDIIYVNKKRKKKKKKKK